MLTSLKKSFLVCLIAAAAQPAWAFSLLGPLEGWQTLDIGYGLPSDIGGPKNLGEEYRWSSPVVTFGFDSTFLTYFGSNGVLAIEKAMAILNALPRVSSLSSNLTERAFQGEKRGINHQAAALGLLDLKTFALGYMMEELGLASPDRYTWTLRSRVVVNNVPLYTTIQRNFDPVTLRPSRFVNGTFYTYQIFQTYGSPDVWEAVELQVDPASSLFSSLAALIDTAGGTIQSAQGFFPTPPDLGVYFSGLTRDDIGGLRYILHPLNFNVETLPPGTTGGGFGGGGGVVDGGSWSDPFGSSAGLSDLPWSDPGFVITNILTNITTTNIVIGGAIVDPALRPGVDKLTFLRVDYDSLIGQSFAFTKRYVDTFVTNRVAFRQGVEELIVQPDILFAAEDLGVNAVGYPFRGARTIAFIDNSALNSIAASAGPGNIQATVTVVFSKLGPSLRNIGDGSELDAFVIPFWGSFDGTTNEPIVYPAGFTIRELEELVLRRR